jgi:hypothetical protein
LGFFIRFSQHLLKYHGLRQQDTLISELSNRQQGAKLETLEDSPNSKKTAAAKRLKELAVLGGGSSDTKTLKEAMAPVIFYLLRSVTYDSRTATFLDYAVIFSRYGIILCCDGDLLY